MSLFLHAIEEKPFNGCFVHGFCYELHGIVMSRNRKPLPPGIGCGIRDCHVFVHLCSVMFMMMYSMSFQRSFFLSNAPKDSPPDFFLRGVQKEALNRFGGFET